MDYEIKAIGKKILEYMDYSQEYLLEKLESRRFKTTKKGKNDFVSSCDVHLEEKFLEMVDEEFPETNIIAEEKISRDKGSRITFIIDPIDGTNNFVHGMPIFGTSVAVFMDSKPAFGAIGLHPDRKTLYAYSGKGAFCNGKRLEKPKENELSEAFVLLDSRIERAFRLGFDKGLGKLSANVSQTRLIGAAVYNICYVPLGIADGAVELDLKVVDYAASCIIAEENGCRTATLSGRPWHELKDKTLAVGSGDLAEKLIGFLKE